jgi:hypothetical protein
MGWVSERRILERSAFHVKYTIQGDLKITTTEFGKSDHDSVLLFPVYKLKVKQEVTMRNGHQNQKLCFRTALLALIGICAETQSIKSTS